MSRESWHVPAEREPGVLYMHGQPGTDYDSVQAIEVDGQRFERVRECAFELDGMGDGKLWRACSICGGYVSADYDPPRFCPHCGAKVVNADD